MTSDCHYGYRLVGNLWGQRRLVDAGRALAGYCACDATAKVESEAYLSAFRFPLAFRTWMDDNGSPKGYADACGSPWLWLDIDQAGDLDGALRTTRRLVGLLLERYRTLDEGDLLTFFSGAKGFHTALPLAWGPPPSESFPAAARVMAERLAELAGVRIDSGVYDRVRAFRAPNSTHPKTGLHKRRLALDELLHLPIGRILDLAREPLPFDLPTTGKADPVAIADWAGATEVVRQRAEGIALRRADASTNGPTLNRPTLDYIRDGATEGDRHRLLFSASANLAEFGCPPALAHALLTEAGRDSGLSPSDVTRQIDCGLTHGRGANADHQYTPPGTA